MCCIIWCHTIVKTKFIVLRNTWLHSMTSADFVRRLGVMWCTFTVRDVNHMNQVHVFCRRRAYVLYSLKCHVMHICGQRCASHGASACLPLTPCVDPSCTCMWHSLKTKQNSTLIRNQQIWLLVNMENIEIYRNYFLMNYSEVMA